MENGYKDRFVKVCPFCGAAEMLEGYQDAYGSISGKNNPLGGSKLCHVVCRKCGTVVRSYVEKPEKLLRRKDRVK